MTGADTAVLDASTQEDMAALSKRMFMEHIEAEQLSPEQRLGLSSYFSTLDIDGLSERSTHGGKVPPEILFAGFNRHKLNAYNYDINIIAREAAAPEPHIVEDKVVLYRCISIGELEDVLQTGEFGGQRNAWHSGDARRMVLFLDVDNMSLRSQGGDIVRAVKRRFVDHPLYVRYQELATADLNNRGRSKKLYHDEPCAKMEQAKEAFEEFIRPLVEAEECRLRNASWHTAVVRTIPLAGAMVWHTDHQQNLMVSTEYGFPPGMVKAEDIAEVTLLKDNKPVLSGSLDDIELVLAQHRISAGMLIDEGDSAGFRP